MKNTFLPFSSLLVAAIILVSCNSKSSDNTVVESPESQDVGEPSPEPTVPSAICIWKEVSVRATPSEKGKYLTSVYLGEKMEALQDTTSEVVNGKRYHYQHVKLVDNTEGWVRADFIAVNAIAAAFFQDATIYKRPDLMTSTKKTFATMDFVAIKNSTEDGWAEVIGKRSGDTWFTTAWVRRDNLATNPNDVMFSVLYAKAMETKDEDDRLVEIQKLLANSDLNGSQFYAQINSIYGEATGNAEESGDYETDEIESDTTGN